jgi:hypothetical protein
LTGEEKAKAGLGIGIIIFAAILMLMIRSQPNSKASNESALAIQTEETAEETKEAEISSSNFDDIKVTADFQDFYYDRGKQKVVIWIKNESSQTFSGKVYVRIVDNSDISYGRDIIYPENLMPGKSVWAIIWSKPGGQALNCEIDGNFEGEPKAKMSASEIAEEYFDNHRPNEKFISAESLGETEKGEKIKIISSGDKSRETYISFIYIKNNQVAYDYLLYKGNETLVWKNPEI